MTNTFDQLHPQEYVERDFIHVSPEGDIINLKEQFLRSINSSYAQVSAHYNAIIKAVIQQKEAHLLSLSQTDRKNLTPDQLLLVEKLKEDSSSEKQHSLKNSLLSFYQQNPTIQSKFPQISEKQLWITLKNNTPFNVDIGDDVLDTLPQHTNYSKIASISFVSINTRLVQILNSYFPNLRKLVITETQNSSHFTPSRGLFGGSSFTQNLNNSDLTADTFSELLRNKTIQSFDVDLNSFGTKNSDFIDFLSSHPLKTLILRNQHLSNVNLTRIISKNNRFEGVIFQCHPELLYPMLSDHIYEFLLDRIPNLKHFEMIYPEIDAKSAEILSRFTALESLKFYDGPSEVKVKENFANVRYHVKNNPSNIFPQENCLRILTQNLPNLKVLHYSTAPLSQSSLRLIAERLPLIQDLYVECRDVEPSGFKHIAGLKNLKSLCLMISFKALAKQNIKDILQFLASNKCRLQKLHLILRITRIMIERPGLFGQQQVPVEALLVDYSNLLENQTNLVQLRLGNRTNDRTCMAISNSPTLTTLEMCYTSENKLPKVTNAGFAYLSKLRNLKQLSVVGINELQPEAEDGYFRLIRNNTKPKISKEGLTLLRKKTLRNLLVMGVLPNSIKQGQGLQANLIHRRSNGMRRNLDQEQNGNNVQNVEPPRPQGYGLFGRNA